MNNDFERIKDSVDLRQVITGQTGLTVNKAGHLEHCPFCSGHDCFSIPKNGKYLGSFKCHQCDLGGDVFTFLEKFHGLDRSGSLKMAAELAGVALEERKPRALQLSAIDRIRIAAAEHYHSHLLVNGGMQYFREHRGHAEQTLQQEMVGWSDGQLHDTLPWRE